MRAQANTLVWLAVLASLAGCRVDRTPVAALPDSAAPTSSSATTTATPTGERAAVLAAYLSFWDAVIAAHRAANAADPRLDAVAADPELTSVRRAVARNRAQQLSVRGAVTHRPSDVSVRGATAVLSDCYDVSRWDPVDLRTGRPVDAVDESGTGRYSARYALRKVARGWVVTKATVEGRC